MGVSGGERADDEMEAAIHHPLVTADDGWMDRTTSTITYTDIRLHLYTMAAACQRCPSLQHLATNSSFNDFSATTGSLSSVPFRSLLG